jgi:Flp pilus assembly protein CpaB
MSTSAAVSAGAGRRVVARRAALPGGRAVAGGFLVALAAVGGFAGWTQATADTRTRYLTAGRDLAVGHRIEAGDLAWAKADLPPFLAARAFRRPSLVVGSVTLGPVGRGELVQASHVLRGTAAAGREISFPIEAARALDGGLRAGETVDVLATYGTGEAAYTLVVVREARVVAVSTPRSALSDARSEVVTLAVPSAADGLAVAHAASAGAVTLVRTSGDNSPPGPASYRAPAA